MGLGSIMGGLIDSSTAANERAANKLAAQVAWRRSQTAATTAWERSRQAAGSANAFTAHMSSTQYQRGMADLAKAGLNPILAYKQGGAGGGQGQMASGPAASGPAAKIPSLAHLGSNFMRNLKFEAELENIKAMTGSAKKQARLNDLKGDGEAHSNVRKKITADVLTSARNAFDFTKSHAKGAWNHHLTQDKKKAMRFGNQNRSGSSMERR